MLITLTAADDNFYAFDGFLGGTTKSSLQDVKNSTVDGGAGTDTLILEYAYPDENFSLVVGSTGVVTLSAASGNITFSNIERFKYSNASIVVGSTGNDSVSGASTNDPALYGLAGNDTLNGGAGSDTLYGGAGNDTYIVDNAGDRVRETTTPTGSTDAGGVDLVQSAINYVLGDFVENLTLKASVGLSGTGNALGNKLKGGTGNDTLSGAAGNDQLDGGAGNDVMRGGAGNDTYVVKNAGDVLDESTAPGSGIDAGGKELVKSSVSFTLGNFLENLTLSGKGNINATGNALANNLTGNAGNNALSGGDGGDQLKGGAGNDLLTGGKGVDLFVFDKPLNALTNVDTITDWDSGGAQDRIQLDHTVFAALGAVTRVTALDPSMFAAGSAAADANDHIIYNAATGALFYDADGNGAGAQVQFATVGSTVHPALTAADLFVI